MFVCAKLGVYIYIYISILRLRGKDEGTTLFKEEMQHHTYHSRSVDLFDEIQIDKRGKKCYYTISNFLF